MKINDIGIILPGRHVSFLPTGSLIARTYDRFVCLNNLEITWAYAPIIDVELLEHDDEKIVISI